MGETNGRESPKDSMTARGWYASARSTVATSLDQHWNPTPQGLSVPGSIGTAAVQLARYLGADITAVCNTKNVETVRSLGAGQVIDYTREDFTANGQTYDAIYDAAGKQSFRRCARSLKPGGEYLATDGLQNVVLAVWTARRAGKKVVFPVPPRYARQDVLFLGGLIEAGEYRPVIDRCYPLEQVVEATRYVETQQKTGNVVLTVSDDRR
jgi:NADPH:quinone reductase-like Zn-dependent oxidoreductase